MADIERVKRHIQYLVERELGVRQDTLVRAKQEYSRGFMQADELADYEADVAFEKEVRAACVTLTYSQ